MFHILSLGEGMCRDCGESACRMNYGLHNVVRLLFPSVVIQNSSFCPKVPLDQPHVFRTPAGKPQW